MSSSSESDPDFWEKLNSGKWLRKRKVIKHPLKRNKREGMCQLQEDEKSSQESNIIRINTDSELDNYNFDESKNCKNIIELEDDEELENSMLEIDI